MIKLGIIYIIIISNRCSLTFAINQLTLSNDPIPDPPNLKTSLHLKLAPRHMVRYSLLFVFLSKPPFQTLRKFRLP